MSEVIDIVAAKAELLAESKPITLRFSTGDWTFPAVMPAEVELEQMALNREAKERGPDEPVPDGTQERLMRAVFGQEQYEELTEKVPQSELVLGFMKLLTKWAAPYSDPNLPQRLLEQSGMTQPLPAGALSLSGSSPSSGSTSRPTSGGSTESISPTPSGANGGSVGGASSRSTSGSVRKR